MQRVVGWVVLSSLGVLGLAGCGEAAGTYTHADGELSEGWAALLADADVERVASALTLGGGMAGLAERPGAPPRSCLYGCSREPLALVSFDDCHAMSTGLSRQGYYPAYRAVETPCVAGASEQGVAFQAPGDVVYLPDQPAFAFDQGLTVAAFVHPSQLEGTQTIVRKRSSGTSSFVLALRHGQLELGLRFEDGRTTGLSAPIVADRWTHVAATYDGIEARLYVDGELAARVEAGGVLLGGAGPIFVGNDASERRFDGLIDELWLNTLAAPPDVVATLQCARGPLLAITPHRTAPQTSGDLVIFDFSIESLADASCAPEQFEAFPSATYPLESYPSGQTVSVAPGETAHVAVGVSSVRVSELGEYPFRIIAFGGSSLLSGEPFATATFVVGQGPLACVGVEPPGPAIRSGYPTSFAPEGVAWPSMGSYVSDAGELEALTVYIDPEDGSALPEGAYWDAGLSFSEPACVDASAYAGVSFSIQGELGSCSVVFSALFSQDLTANDERGACIDRPCSAPISAPFGLGQHVFRFADLTGGTPLPDIDPTKLTGLLWRFLPSPDPSAPRCNATVAIENISFVP
jgi:concanavalin A-like lectin/glucanase superfamily protein